MSKANPSVQLVISEYLYRSYYCAVISEPDRKPLAYFEHDLVSPVYSFLKIDPRKVQHVFGVM